MLSKKLRAFAAHDPKRRELLRRGLSLSGIAASGIAVQGCMGGGNSNGFAGRGTVLSLGDIGPLAEPDENKLSLPQGFTSRIVARTGQTVPGTSYAWHVDPDGGATYATEDGGWIYVSNSEDTPGGVGALRFNAEGGVIDAYSICEKTRNNCAGGPTPWGTWMTCEEAEGGQVFECDPLGKKPQRLLPAMGRYAHEAVAIDPVHKAAYLTEDRGDGGFYRCVPSSYPDFAEGKLYIAQIIDDRLPGPSPVVWNEITDPQAGVVELVNPLDASQRLISERNPTRQQADYTPFIGGEGIWYFEGILYFSTKGDNRIWAYDTETDMVEIVYDLSAQTVPDGEVPPLFEVDNVTVSGAGDVIVAEDRGDLRLVVITPERQLKTLVKVHHEGSELTGPAFSPDGRRLYFSSQRGDAGEGGITFEVMIPEQFVVRPHI